MCVYIYTHTQCIYILRVCVYIYMCLCIYIYIQGVSRLVDNAAEGDFLGLCDQKRSYKHVSDFGRLRIYGHFLIAVHAVTVQTENKGNCIERV